LIQSILYHYIVKFLAVGLWLFRARGNDDLWIWWVQCESDHKSCRQLWVRSTDLDPWGKIE